MKIHLFQIGFIILASFSCHAQDTLDVKKKKTVSAYEMIKGDYDTSAYTIVSYTIEYNIGKMWIVKHRTGAINVADANNAGSRAYVRDIIAKDKSGKLVRLPNRIYTGYIYVEEKRKPVTK